MLCMGTDTGPGSLTGAELSGVALAGDYVECGFIGATVQHVAVVDGVSIDIEFGGDRRLRVPLDDDARVGPEAAHFLPDDWPDAPMWVYSR